MSNEDAPRIYRTMPGDRAPLIDFMISALERSGCRIIHRPKANRAPFRITFETSSGERLGIMAYAFLANNTLTKKRPPDEHRFQVKYGSDFESEHEIWQDPFGLYTTLFVGINTERGFFVGADPVLHNPTWFSKSIEFKDREADEIQRQGWYAWERARQADNESSDASDTTSARKATTAATKKRGLKKSGGSADDEDGGPVEVLVGGTPENFLRFVRFERDAVGEDQGHRQLLADKFGERPVLDDSPTPSLLVPSPDRLHQLAHEFEMKEYEVLDMIGSARRLKMAVRGWVAETHLARQLSLVPGVTDCERSDKEGGVDVLLRYQGSRQISVECKNALRQTTARGLVRVDFQRTRASKNNPCSRFYSPRDFDVVAACLHSVTERWEFRFAPSAVLDRHGKCPGKLSHLVKLDERWNASVQQVLRAVVNG